MHLIIIIIIIIGAHVHTVYSVRSCKSLYLTFAENPQSAVRCETAVSLGSAAAVYRVWGFLLNHKPFYLFISLAKHHHESCSSYLKIVLKYQDYLCLVTWR